MDKFWTDRPTAAGISSFHVSNFVRADDNGDDGMGEFHLPENINQFININGPPPGPILPSPPPIIRPIPQPYFPHPPPVPSPIDRNEATPSPTPTIPLVPSPRPTPAPSPSTYPSPTPTASENSTMLPHITSVYSTNKLSSYDALFEALEGIFAICNTFPQHFGPTPMSQWLTNIYRVSLTMLIA